MAITQPIGNVRVMPQAPDTGDPLAGMKAFAVGTQLGQELAGLSLASEKLKFEKAKLAAQSQGLKLEQLRAQMALSTAAEDIKRAKDIEDAKLAEANARARLAGAEADIKERERTLATTDFGPALANLLGDATVEPPAAEEVAPVLAPEAPAPPAAAPTFSIEPPKAPEAPKSFAYQPKFGSADLDPAQFLAVPQGSDPMTVALASERERGRREREAFVRQFNITKTTSPSDAVKLLPKAAELGEKLKSARPSQGVLAVTDQKGTPLAYPVLQDSSGQPVAVTGAPRIDVAAVHKMYPGYENTDKAFGTEYAAVIKAAPRAAENIAALEAAEKGLLKGDGYATGPLVSALPVWVRRRFPGLREGVNAQVNVEKVVSQTLREILGGQFAMREGEQLLQRAFDPAMPEEENVRRLRSLLATVKTAAQASEAATSYFKQNGTLFGYDGLDLGALRSQIVEQLEGMAGGAPAAKGAPTSARAVEANAAAEYLADLNLGGPR